MANLAKILLLGSVMAFSTISISPALAQTRPGSVDVATGTWKVMNPSTYQATNEDMILQFDRVAARDPRLTPEKRVLLAQMLKAKEGEVTMVPDGIVLPFLTGRRGGQPNVWTDMKKELGRDDRALRFELGDGITVYWFTGAATSCNNIGVVIKSMTPYVAAPPPPPVVVPEDRLTPIPSPMIGGSAIVTNGFISPLCCCGITFTPGIVVPGPNHLPQQPAVFRGSKQQ